MADDEELAELATLDRELAKGRKKVERSDKYYEGEQPLRYMAPALEAEVGSRITQIVVNFPRIAVEAYDHRLDVEGFRCPTKALDKRVHEWVKSTDFAELSQLGIQDSLALGRSFGILGSGEDPDNDPPVLTIESPRDVAVRRDPKTRTIRSGLKRWQEDDKSSWAQLYLPDATVTFEKKGRGWAEVERDEHDVGEVLVVPLVNYPRTSRPDGRSEIHDIIPLADATNIIATNMMISADFHAMPRRWALGFEKEDFLDEFGKRISAWEQVAGRVWASSKGPKEAQLGQFDEASLENFHNTIRLLAQLIGQLLALPAHYVNFTTDNPPSAEGVKASESRTIKRAERKQGNLSVPFKTIVRLADRIATGRWDPKSRLIETQWRDPSTPTRAQAADAAVKLVGQGKPVIPREQAWEDLGYTDEQKQRMRDWFAEEARTALVGLAALGVGEPPEPEG